MLCYSILWCGMYARCDTGTPVHMYKHLILSNGNVHMYIRTYGTSQKKVSVQRTFFQLRTLITLQAFRPEYTALLQGALKAISLFYVAGTEEPFTVLTQPVQQVPAQPTCSKSFQGSCICMRTAREPTALHLTLSYLQPQCL